MDEPTSPKFDPILQKILQEWEQARLAGNGISIEQLCAQHPEISQQIKLQIQNLSEMDWLNYGARQKHFPASDGKAKNSILLLLGEDVINGYKLISVIGQGGAGEVWKAEGPGGMPVALKMVPISHGLAPKEIRALEMFKNIRHSHLLSIFGYWFYKNYLWIAMELADGSLMELHQSYVDSGQPGIPIEQMLGYFQEAAEALDFLNYQKHPMADGSEGFVQHGDVKLTNLLLVGNSIKLGDIGLAKTIKAGANEHSGSFTASYAPPEYFDGKSFPSSDQYALAVCYVRLRGGCLPFDGTVAQVMNGHCHGKPDLSKVPENEHQIILRALSKEPDQRWGNTCEFIRALKVANHLS